MILITKLRPNLNINKDRIGINPHRNSYKKNLKKYSKNILIGCIYRHPCMQPKEFNNLFLNPSHIKQGK